MNEAQAISLLVNVARLAQSKGLFSLEDAVTVYQAIKVVELKDGKNKETRPDVKGGEVLPGEKKGEKQNGK